MTELLKETFELFVKMRWLKTIDKEVDKYIKLKEKLNRQQYVVNSLEKRFKEIYGIDIRTPQKINHDSLVETETYKVDGTNDE